jgi:hypothetical protein
MSLWNRMFGGRRAGAHGAPRWLGREESPFGIEVLDCRGLDEAARAASVGPEAAARFAASRADDGTRHRGTVPQPPVTLDCRLEYPMAAPLPEGALFRATTTDEKWDLFLFEDSLYAVRSAGGTLEYRAALAWLPGRLRVVRVSAHAELAEAEPAYVIAAVDFLIRTHVLGLEAPHPLPAAARGEPEELALLSWRQHGRFARFGAYADTSRLPLEQPGAAQP